MAVSAYDGKRPLFALASFGAARNFWRKATRLCYSCCGHASHVEWFGWQTGLLLSPQSS
jgi:hypothetical protein